MEQLLAHLIGDYVLQNHWMANTKTKSWVAAITHGTFYSLPFLFLVEGWQALFVIWSTHILIDRFRIAKYWVDFWGVGTEGYVIQEIMRSRGYTRLMDSNVPSTPVWLRLREGTAESIVATPGRILDGKIYDEVPVVPDPPPFLAVWLLILVDNTMHLTINYSALKWL